MKTLSPIKRLRMYGCVHMAYLAEVIKYKV